jgi:ketosteroid isomerase-like protein
VTSQQKEIVTSLFRGINAFDPDFVQTLFTEDASVIQPAKPVYHGRAGVRDMINDLARQSTGWEAHPLRTVAEENIVAVEWSASITDFGGGKGRVDGVAVLDFERDRIKRLRLYWRPEDLHD